MPENKEKVSKGKRVRKWCAFPLPCVRAHMERRGRRENRKRFFLLCVRRCRHQGATFFSEGVMAHPGFIMDALLGNDVRKSGTRSQNEKEREMALFLYRAWSAVRHCREKKTQMLFVLRAPAVGILSSRRPWRRQR